MTLGDVLDVIKQGKKAHDLLVVVNDWLWKYKSSEFSDNEAGDPKIYAALKEYFSTYGNEFEA